MRQHPEHAPENPTGAPAKHEHVHDHPDMDKLLATELQHPIHANPEQWLDQHETEVRECFRDTGILHLRVPGSGVLKNPWKWVESLAKYVKSIEAKQSTPVKVILRSHRSCGAAGMKFPGPQQEADDLAGSAQEVMVKNLRERGVDAEHGGDAPMNGLKAHNALGAAIDGTQGQMQHSPFNSFVVSSPDTGDVASEAELALKISSGSHSYGDRLKQYTVIVFSDPAHPETAASVIHDLRRRIEPFERKGIRVTIAQRRAPVAEKRGPVKQIVVDCIDERVKSE